MSETPSWLYQEEMSAGKNYSEIESVEQWEATRRRLGDVDAENESLLDLLEVDRETTLLDIGAGPGLFATAAARRCGRVIAVDISPLMLEYGSGKARQEGLENLEFRPGGFLSYQHTGEPVDIIVSQIVLHHLPDFWKAYGLRRVADMLKPGGRFHLTDIVYSFEPEQSVETFERNLDYHRQSMGEDFARDLEAHFRDEYSTFDWIMEGLLRTCGFRILETSYSNHILATYLCERETP